MIEDYAKITAEYRDADFNQRLHMYLQFPHLRSKFILIDRNDLNTDFCASTEAPGNGRIAQISR